MKLAISVGVPISEFWEITPYELNLVAIQHREKQNQDFKEKVSLEYYNAMWTIQWLGKKSEQPEPLKKILDSLYVEKEERKEMTDEDMLQQVKILNTMFGGIEK